MDRIVGRGVTSGLGRLMQRLRTMAAVGALSWAFQIAAASEAAAVTNVPPALHNVFRLTPQILSGSQPEGEAAFAWLAAQGVRTIVSVDGARPDVEAARRHGLRYVHLPFGYDGVPTNRVAELAKLARTLPGPFYVHCHHGQHRGPAAAAVLCEASAGWSPAQAEAFLKQAGTAPDYPGLYRSVHGFQAPDPASLDALTNALPEIAPTPGLVPAMVALDGHLDRLRTAQQAGWRTPPEHPDVAPAHDATLIWEQFRELARALEGLGKPASFMERLRESEAAADELRQALRETTDGPVSIGGARLPPSGSSPNFDPARPEARPTGSTTKTRGLEAQEPAPKPSSPVMRADAALRRLADRCSTCHREHRN